MKTILTDRKFDGYGFPEDVQVKVVTCRTIRGYDYDASVVAIAGSRAMAALCADLHLPGLKLFQLTSAGFDGVPCDVYAKKGIAVANAGSVYSAPIAETVVFGILSMAKKLRQNPANRRFKLLRHYKYISELLDKKAMILGAGNIGTAVAERLSGFGMVIDGYDPYCPEKAQYSKLIRSREELLTVIRDYDYVISTLPDTPETRAFVDRELLKAMKASAVFVNVGRKAAICEADLYDSLRSRRIGGAVLDIFEKIPNPITNRFRRLRNVIVLPGVAAISQEVTIRLNEHIYRNLMCVMEGKPIHNVVNGVK